LYWAALNDHRDAVKLLLAHGADVNTKDDSGWTPLHWAAHKGSKAVAELQLAHGTEVNAKDDGGFTPLHRAVKGSHKDVAEGCKRKWDSKFLPWMECESIQR
jgi:ankyrin repeat protein